MFIFGLAEGLELTEVVGFGVFVEVSSDDFCPSFLSLGVFFSYSD